MTGPDRLGAVFSALETAEDAMARTLRAERSAVVLLSKAGEVAELVTAHGIDRDVGEALLHGAAGIVERLRRAGEPIRIEQRDLLARRRTRPPWGSAGDPVSVVPILGETGVVGFAAFPHQTKSGQGRSADPSWRLASRVLKCAQLDAAHDALRIALAWERRNRAELVDGILVVDAQGRVLFADGRFAALAEWGAVDPLGREVSELPGGVALASLKRTVRDDPLWIEETIPELGIGGPLELASVTRTAGDRDGGYVVLLREREGDASRPDGVARMVGFTMRVSQLADEIAHSVRLVKASSVKGAASVLLPRMEEAILAAGRTVEEGLGRSLGEGSSQLDVNAMVEDVLQRCRIELEAEGVRAIAITADDLPAVPGDRFVVLGALRTLMLTARDFLRPSGGTLTLRTTVDDEWVHIGVADNGAGRAGGKSDERVFVTQGDAYRSALDAVRRRLERMGGRLSMDRRPGLWNRSTIMLRRERRKAHRGQAPPGASTQNDEPGRSLRVLVVDDNAALRSVLRRYLERRGHAVTEACDGEEGLRVLQAREFDRLVVDIQMPHKDGLELFDALTGVQPALRERTIFVTGGFLDDDAARSVRAAGRPSIRKPFDLIEMARTVEECCA